MAYVRASSTYGETSEFCLYKGDLLALSKFMPEIQMDKLEKYYSENMLLVIDSDTNKLKLLYLKMLLKSPLAMEVFCSIL